MSSIETASTTRFSYHRLRNEGGSFEEEGKEERVTKRTRSWSRVRSFPSKRRPTVRIPGLRRFLSRKFRALRRVRVFSAVRVSCSKVLRRLKDSKSHWNDLFAGNYLFMQVSPAPLKCVDKSFMGHDLHGLSSRYSLGKIA